MWDKDGDRWMLQSHDPAIPGGVWCEADARTPAVRRWAELIESHGPLTDVEPRCAATCYFGDDSNGYEQVERCLLAVNHAGHHKLPDGRWDTP